MSDLPLEKVNEIPTPKSGVPAGNPKENRVEVTHENADILTVHFLSQIHGRLGYIIKLLEDKK
jgi:hypothetical protein